MGSLLSMLCAERARLIDEYRNAVRYYSECVNELADVANDHTNVQLLQKLILQAWTASERARVALARHQSEHFCESDLGAR